MVYVAYFFTAIFLISGFGHLLAPRLTDGFLPDVLPKQTVQILAFVVEVAVGVGLLLPRFREPAAWATLVLMVLFLPLHAVDVLRDRPVIGSHTVAYVRVMVQLLFIYLAWRLVQAAG